MEVMDNRFLASIDNLFIPSFWINLSVGICGMAQKKAAFAPSFAFLD